MKAHEFLMHLCCAAIILACLTMVSGGPDYWEVVVMAVVGLCLAHWLGGSDD